MIRFLFSFFWGGGVGQICSTGSQRGSAGCESVVEFSTGLTRLIRNDSAARFSFKLSGSSNYDKPCNSNFSKIFEL